MVSASSMQVARVRLRRRFSQAGGSAAPCTRCSYSQKPPSPAAGERESPVHAAAARQQHRAPGDREPLRKLALRQVRQQADAEQA